MTTPNPVPADWSVLHYIAAGSAGLAIGVGVMITLLAKYGRKLLGIEGEAVVVKEECPYAKDHPELQKFMGESKADRADLRDFLEDIDEKIDTTGRNVAEMKGKLDLLLQGARVRWNSGIIPPEIGGKP